eukprot:Lithocolla_globosa_v1_NODE_4950_length_1331_cov_117.227273.p2 type:complete len:107 gc:universal NODE_4950_length_1331_cov_117.227273:907-587(-)
MISPFSFSFESLSTLSMGWREAGGGALTGTGYSRGYSTVFRTESRESFSVQTSWRYRRHLRVSAPVGSGRLARKDSTSKSSFSLRREESSLFPSSIRCLLTWSCLR